MIKVPLRAEDYWIFPLSFVGTMFSVVALYAGVAQIRLSTGVAGVILLIFTTYVVAKNYSRAQGARHAGVYVVTTIALAWGAYVLTN